MLIYVTRILQINKINVGVEFDINIQHDKVYKYNSYLQCVFSHLYQLDDSISNVRVVGGSFHFFIQILKDTSVSMQ